MGKVVTGRNLLDMIERVQGDYLDDRRDEVLDRGLRDVSVAAKDVSSFGRTDGDFVEAQRQYVELRSQMYESDLPRSI